jgi:hypothetical protein
VNLNRLPPEYRAQVAAQLDIDVDAAPAKKPRNYSPKPANELTETVLPLPATWRELVALTMMAHQLQCIEMVETDDYVYVYYASKREVDARTVAEWFRKAALPCYRVGMDVMRDQMYAVIRKAS